VGLGDGLGVVLPLAYGSVARTCHGEKEGHQRVYPPLVRYRVAQHALAKTYHLPKYRAAPGLLRVSILRVCPWR